MPEISKYDIEQLEKIRKNVTSFISKIAKEKDSPKIRLLDIAPQDHEGAKPYFKKAQLETLDIDPDSGATYIADLCDNNRDLIQDNTFDIVVCTEVLEHTLQPFEAVKEIKRILKPRGVALVSTPYDFRIHGPLPDSWRFTEHGLRTLFKDFTTTEVRPLENNNRFLMPVHYTLIAVK